MVRCKYRSALSYQAVGVRVFLNRSDRASEIDIRNSKIEMALIGQRAMLVLKNFRIIRSVSTSQPYLRHQQYQLLDRKCGKESEQTTKQRREVCGGLKTG